MSLSSSCPWVFCEEKPSKNLKVCVAIVTVLHHTENEVWTSKVSNRFDFFFSFSVIVSSGSRMSTTPVDVGFSLSSTIARKEKLAFTRVS